MLHIIINNIWKIPRAIAPLLMALAFCSFGNAAEKVDLVQPLSDLFSHKAHKGAFEKTQVSCTDCHSFAIKAATGDPTAPGVGAGHLIPNRKVCHECHLGKVSTPRPNQCTLCHSDLNQIKPSSHRTGWRARHGIMAQADQDSCLECHSQKTCTQCHSQRDTLKPSVHKANFRVTHSIEARANPQSCVTCHSNSASRIQCHTRGLK